MIQQLVLQMKILSNFETRGQTTEPYWVVSGRGTYLEGYILSIGFEIYNVSMFRITILRPIWMSLCTQNDIE